MTRDAAFSEGKSRETILASLSGALNLGRVRRNVVPSITHSERVYARKEKVSKEEGGCTQAGSP
jgi:hypothetical protein